MLPHRQTSKNPKTIDLVKEHSSLDMWHRSDRIIVLCPCVNNEVLNLICTHWEVFPWPRIICLDKITRVESYIHDYDGWIPSLLTISRRQI